MTTNSIGFQPLKTGFFGLFEDGARSEFDHSDRCCGGQCPPYEKTLLLGGLALKASELKPTPYSQPTPENIVALREQQATDTQKQIIKDVTRYRYGQDVHLDESLKKLGLSPTDEEAPVLTSIKEVAVDGAYTLVLAFDSPLIDLELWQEKQDRIGRFFGPDVRAEVTESEEDEVEVALIKVNSTADEHR